MTQTIQKNQNYNLVPYKIDNNKTIDVTQIKDDVWLTQKQIAQLFDCSKMNISSHFKTIFDIGELDKNSVVKDFFITANDGKQYNVAHYNRRAIFHVGYRVNSKMGMMFRNWASDVLEEKVTGEKNINKKTQKFISTEKKERAKLIKDLLFQKGITQKQIGEEIGLSYVSVCYAINGHKYSRLAENWLKEHLGIGKNENDFNEKSKEIFDEALEGSFSAYKKVNKILKAVAAAHNFT